MKRTSRKTTNRSESLQRHLNAYALAASAAGVGVLALAQPAEAEIVYTPAHKHIWPNHVLKLDLTGGKTVDFVLTNHPLLSNTYFWHAAFSVSGRPGNQIAGQSTGRFHNNLLASALSAGAQVGPKGRKFVDAAVMYECTSASGSGQCLGSWEGGKARYLGLKFQIAGQTHYGWARLRVDFYFEKGKRITGLLTGYAYETIPNKPIITGKTKGPGVITLEPDSLGALAAGTSKK